jgi:hypothetical protein
MSHVDGMEGFYCDRKRAAIFGGKLKTAERLNGWFVCMYIHRCRAELVTVVCVCCMRMRGRPSGWHPALLGSGFQGIGSEIGPVMAKRVVSL